MESTDFHKRSRRFTAAAAALALSLAVPAGAPAASIVSGGTEPAGGSGSAGHTTKGHPTNSHATGTAGGTATGRSKRAAPAPAVKIAGAHCVPSSNCSTNPHQVTTHGTLLLTGPGVKAGLVVAFPRVRGARIASNSPSSRLHQSKLGLVVTVPASAHSGDIAVVLVGGRRSNAYGPINVVRYALHPPKPPRVGGPPINPPAPPSASVSAAGTGFAGQGMWIWYMSASDGGSVAAIAAQAHAAGVTTVFVKSSDGSTNYWNQFSPQLVAELHANGLKACAWQYVYGSNPVGEAELGARAVASGADCLVIDAESQYEGHYGAAQTYIDTLRAKIGPAYPLGLASFPYVDYHESFPYSVFLGPGGAQFNAPQMYWHDIGTSVANVYVHTYEENLIYGRAIAPLGQTYGGVGSTELVSFRSLAGPYGAPGVSFWDWQETSSSGWAALAAALNTALTVPQPELTAPLLSEGARGDQVLWLQEHLASAVPGQPTTGVFDSQTAEDLQQFQTAHGIAATGETDTNTWAALLALPPVAVNWTGGGPNT
jgi:peptidoglycan hydrolase-like protein with peptidoglycan-binding domain